MTRESTYIVRAPWELQDEWNPIILPRYTCFTLLSSSSTVEVFFKAQLIPQKKQQS